MLRSFVVTLVLSVAVVAMLVGPPPRVIRESDLRPMLLRPSLARTLSRPYLSLLVEVLWLRALNAVGNPDSLRKNLALSEYGQGITDLDPRFYQAYVYTGLNIPYFGEREWLGGDKASALFRKGLKVFPSDMRLHLYLGFALMNYEKRYLEAGDVFASAARLPEALPFMAALATRLKSHGGNAEEALDLARELVGNATDESLKAELEERVGDLEVEVQLQRVDRAIELYRREHLTDGGVVDLGTVVDAGYYSGPLEDARGGRIFVRESDGKVLSTSLERRLELYQ